MVETNLIGPMTATEVFLEQLRDGGGDIVNVSSVVGRTASADFAVYAATKLGMNGWSESLRLELQPNIRVIVIEPGAVATELTDHIAHADSKRAAQEATVNTHISPRGHRRSHRLRCQPPAARGAQRDTRAPHRPGALTGHASVSNRASNAS
jgi:short-subunit dehydrogenase